jgi:DMSO/TMAO reductase YedYZ molybdopterin-dependent catalytic subunit
MNPNRRRTCWVLLGGSLLIGPAVAQAPQQVRVTGNVAQALSLGVDDLRQLPQQRVEDARGGEKGGRAMRRYVGARLRDVLDRARLVETQPRGLRKSVVVVTASDGYRVVFSWAEIYLSPIGDGVLLVYEQDGAPLPQSDGPIALVSLKDTSPGPRHVKWLQSVEVRSIAD